MAVSMDTSADNMQTIADNEVVKSTYVPHDSMVTVRLSEPPTLTVVTHAITLGSLNDELDTMSSDSLDTDADTDDLTPEDIGHVVKHRSARPSTFIASPDMIRTLFPITVEEEPSMEEDEHPTGEGTKEAVEGEVNWAELEKTEEQEPRDQDSEDSTALLLARLEQENNLLVTNPKSGLTHVARPNRRGSQSRPPSMQQLKRLVDGPTPSSLRYSLIPTPPMTDLEFYTALVQDYTRTAQRLPTLLSRKIRSGVPPPLRGVVWQSMSGARDRLLEDQYDRLSGEASPYEGMIGKDIGRSFPGVEMFRDPGGDGQRMLGRVLKCFSLYDHKIGYCQGLGFLVGPLLMHMGDKQAFCVLVRLMEHYDLRSCFLPDLSGLHVRIYQFRELLKSHLSKLNAHLELLQVEPTYVSQWFLSFFAVTCPLPMLFRIYDVIFAEGASETIMRVALSVMRKNEEKILACTEFEDVMQLLLSRGLWDCYHYNADEFVNDFVSLTSVVTNESLQALKTSYQDAKALGVTTSPSFDVGSAASRFLGRIWSGSTTTTKSANLTPGLTAPARPVSFLRRSPSKQSIASTLNSAEGGSESMLSLTSTDATSVSRDSSNTDSSSIRAQSTTFSNSTALAPKTPTNNDKNLHGQIEDLLTALSELQRENAILEAQLQREREQRDEDQQVVRLLLDGLKRKASSDSVKTSMNEGSLETVTASIAKDTQTMGEVEHDIHATLECNETKQVLNEVDASEMIEEPVSQLLDEVEKRFAKQANRQSSVAQSKSQLREELAHSYQKLALEASQSQELNRRLNDMEQHIHKLKEQVKEGHSHARNAYQEKQRLEMQIAELKARKPGANTPEAPAPAGESEWPRRASGHGGLRELRLGRPTSTLSQPTTFNIRTSSLNIQTPTGKENENSSPTTEGPLTPLADADTDTDELVLELVRAKTAEAEAKAETESLKAKLESLKKMVGMGNVESLGHRPSPSQPNLERSMALGAFSSYLVRGTDGKTTTPAGTNSPNNVTSATTPNTATTAVAGTGGGFWTGWGRRTASTSLATVLP